MINLTVKGSEIGGNILSGTEALFTVKTTLKTAEKCLDKVNKDKSYDVVIKEHRKKRSLDANAYCWVLCRKLAEVLGTTDKEVYQEQIKHYGLSTIRPEKNDIVEELVKMWDLMGIGNSHEILGESKLDGYTNVKYYYGSSQYDAKRMARLIDGLVYECKEQGIETLPEGEIERMIKAWGGE